MLYQPHIQPAANKSTMLASERHVSVKERPAASLHIRREEKAPSLRHEHLHNGNTVRFAPSTSACRRSINMLLAIMPVRSMAEGFLCINYEEGVLEWTFDDLDTYFQMSS